MVKRSIERNFGKNIRIDGAKKFGEYFWGQYVCPEYSAIKEANKFELIKENLKDLNSRSLLLICSEYLVDLILEMCLNNKKKVMLIGSIF